MHAEPNSKRERIINEPRQSGSGIFAKIMEMDPPPANRDGEGCGAIGSRQPRNFSFSDKSFVRNDCNSGRPWSQRFSAGSMALFLHIAIIILILQSWSVVTTRSAAGLVTFNVSASGKNQSPSDHAIKHSDARSVIFPAPPLPLLKMSFDDQTLESDLNAESAKVGLPESFGGGCDLTPQVQDALRQSTDVIGQLPTIPAADRSVANVIVVWNDGWLGTTSGSGQEAFAVIRKVITAVASSASMDCRTQSQAGPRLVYLPDNSGKMVILALGSGSWTWQQIADGVPSDDGRTMFAMNFSIPNSSTPQAAPNGVFTSLPSGTENTKVTKNSSDQRPKLEDMLAYLIHTKSASVQ